jgi:FixJ family two-component response regulator
MRSDPLVTVVDDDESVRESLPDLLGELGYGSVAFASAQEFLESDALRKTNCLILDIAMPGMSGPELQAELLRQGFSIPIVFITARIDGQMRERLVQAGAVACLSKPFSDESLQAALKLALGDQ